MGERNFHRYVERCHEEGEAGLLDNRLTQASRRYAPVDEVLKITNRYSDRYDGWNVKQFYSFYVREHDESRGYTWVRHDLEKTILVKQVKGGGHHHKRRERAPMEGMVIHQDGASHEWVSGMRWCLIITLDDATSTHYSMFFVEKEGTASSFRGMRDVIEAHGLPSSFCSDRASHYWHTPEAGGKVGKRNFTRFGRAMKHLGIEMIPACLPGGRECCERLFSIHRERLPKALTVAGIADMDAANVYLKYQYMPAFNNAFTVKLAMEAKAFVRWFGGSLDDMFREQLERTVNKDNTVSFKSGALPISSAEYRNRHVKPRVRIHRRVDGGLAISHGAGKRADFSPLQKKEVSKPGMP